MRAVLDTNVLISGVIATGVPHDVLVAGFDGTYDLVASAETLAEFRETLRKYPDRFGMSDSEIRREVETVRYFAEFVDPDPDIAAVPADPDDDKFVEAAVAGDVAYLVSGDRHLLDLDEFRGVDIVTPRTFYERLDID
ncbi:putative toxin-antitoxin system toxin component, PIN family [Halosimplex pelagicum]|uniref:Putative toxin-antitoxin system toxin component, PIN family n=1 Tax=Halosimplex pelagicum TaxID=869886 RepID=A0A7D5PB80_9EURY|nr:putative toxin-antitoxin system toxin component, PIN family [Halosimplex pelagicum]QLH83941.1 putative toxin-antitoxin system toxin component, PIN family [Halosimplex pelagicum]